jgi:hypothetical protein
VADGLQAPSPVLDRWDLGQGPRLRRLTSCFGDYAEFGRDDLPCRSLQHGIRPRHDSGLLASITAWRSPRLLPGTWTSPWRVVVPWLVGLAFVGASPTRATGSRSTSRLTRTGTCGFGYCVRMDIPINWTLRAGVNMAQSQSAAVVPDEACPL